MFEVAIWGTVAAWFSAIGSTGSLMAAAGYYIYDKRIDARAQAKMISFSFGEQTGGMNIRVSNLSHEAIVSISGFLEAPSDLQVLQQRVVWELKSGEVFDRTERNLAEIEPKDVELPTRTHSLYTFFDENEPNTIREGEHRDLHYDDFYVAGSQVWIFFTDAHGQDWKYEFLTKSLSRNKRRGRKRSIGFRYREWIWPAGHKRRADYRRVAKWYNKHR